MGDAVQLTDLDVIARYSIAVRSATADRDELLETLRSDIAWLERGRGRATSAFRASADDEPDDGDAEDQRPARPTRSAAKKAAPAKRATARRTARS